MFWLKTAGLRLIEFSLYGHGVLHFVELGFALYEEAYVTASVAGFGALTMMLGAVFLGTTHRHTPQPVIEENGSASRISRES